jgi:hypothetical protein
VSRIWRFYAETQNPAHSGDFFRAASSRETRFSCKIFVYMFMRFSAKKRILRNFHVLFLKAIENMHPSPLYESVQIFTASNFDLIYYAGILKFKVLMNIRLLRFCLSVSFGIFVRGVYLGFI